MASATTAYRESSDEKSRLIEKAESSALHPRLRNVLLAMLQHGNPYAAAVENNPNEIWLATLKIAVAVGLPYITVRRAIKKLREREKVLVQTRSSNVAVRCGVCAGSGNRGTCERCKGSGYVIRRPCSYQVDESKLRPRLTVEEFDKNRGRHRSSKPFRPQSVRRSRPSSPPPPVTAPAPPQPSKREQFAMTRAEDRAWKRRQAVKGAMDYYVVTKNLAFDQALVATIRATQFTEEQIRADLEAIKYKAPEAIPPPKAIRPCEEVPEDRDSWKKILRALKAKVNPHSFSTWFAPTRRDHESNGVLYVRVPTKDFLRIADKYGALVQSAIDSLGLEVDVKFVTGEEED